MKKNGFTLVELLSVLVIIGILSAISIAIYTNSIVESRESLSDFQVSQLISSSRTYVAINTIGFNNLFDNMSADGCVALAIKVLTVKGLIGQNVIDPKDTNTNLDGYIKITYDYTNNQYKYEYVNQSVNTTSCTHKFFVNNNDKVCLDTDTADACNN